MSEREIMDPFFAVFNGHCNDADKRARAIMAKECPTWLAKVERCEKDGGGIMAIFDAPPNKRYRPYRAFTRYAELVQKFVNENRA